MPIKKLLAIFKSNATRRKEALARIKDAGELRAVFDLFMAYPPEGSPEAKLHLLKAEDKAVTFELGGGSQARSTWKGEDVTVRFVLRLERNAQTKCYVFQTKVLDFANAAGGGRSLVLAAPLDVEEVVQRRSVRVNVPERYLPAIKAWRLSMPEDGKPRVNLGGLGAPLFSMNPEAAGDVMVHNLSAGGMRISLSATRHRKAKEYLEVDKHLLFWFSIPDCGEAHKTLKFLIAARVARLQEMGRSRLDLGLHFVALGGKDKSGELAWRNVSKKGLEQIAQWVHSRTKEEAQKRGGLGR